MKKFSKVILVLLTLLCMAFGFASCGEKISSIKVGTAPRVQFVQGLDLDLTGGTLTVVYEGKTEEVPLNAEGVTVTGYNRDTLGEQTLTISYKEFSTELKINVVERIKVTSMTTDYFVGDELDLSKGKVTVRSDEGVEKSAKLSASDVTVTGFSSEEAGVKNVTVSYGGYSCQIPVTVHTPTIKFHEPNKTSYDSHETKLSVLGGYFTLSSENGKLTKDVALTEDMVSGFDPSKATMEENVDEPLSQKLTVLFNGEEYSYDITVRFSDVSYFKAVEAELAATLKRLGASWSDKEVPAIPMNLAGKAFEGLCRYLNMKSKDRDYLSQAEIEQLVRPGIIYGAWKWGEAKKSFENTLLIQNGNIYLVADSYEAVSADYDRLVLGTDDFVVVGKQLMKIGEEFGKIVVHGTTTVQNYVDAGYNFESFDEVLNRIRFMLEMYKCLEEVPAEWTMEDLEGQAAKIDTLQRLIVGGGYAAYEFRTLFSIVETWRADFYDIIYTYYYEKYMEALEAKDKTEQSVNSSALTALIKVYLPGELEDLYTIMNSAFVEAQYLRANVLRDTMMMRNYYSEICKIVEKIDAMENKMYSNIYHNFGLENMVYNFVVKVDTKTGYGILTLNGGTHADPTINALWKRYEALYVKLGDAMADRENTFDLQAFLTANASEITAVFTDFANLSPAWQFGFLGAMHSNYLTLLGSVNETTGEPEVVAPVFAYDVVDGVNVAKNNFMFMFGNYYDKAFDNAAARETYHALLEAMEYYARAQAVKTELPKFFAAMETAMQKHDLMPTDVNEKNTKLFNSVFGDIYNKYVALYNARKGEAPELSAEIKAKFDKVVGAVMKVYTYYNSLVASTQGNSFNVKFCGLLLGAYAKAQICVAEILNSNNEEMIAAYYYTPYKVGVDNYGGDVMLTLDYFMFTARERVVAGNILFNVNYYTPFIEVYLVSNMAPVFMQVNDVLVDKYLADTAFTAEDKESVEALMQVIWDIDHSEWYIFEAVGGAYYDALRDYFKDVASTNAETFFYNHLRAIELAYRTYLTYKGVEAKYEDGSTPWEYFVKLVNEAKTAYGELSDTDKTYLNKFFAYYEGIAAAGEPVEE